MRAEFRPLDVPTSSGASGEPEQVERFLNKTIQLSGSWTGEYAIEAKLRGASEYAELIPSLSTNGIHRIDETVYQIRVKCVAKGTDSPEVTFGGEDSRSF